jgi:hypothetical protein
LIDKNKQSSIKSMAPKFTFRKIIMAVVVFLIAMYVYNNYIVDNSLTTKEVKEAEERVSKAAADAGITLEEGDTVVDEETKANFTVIQGGGYPAGGLGGIYRPEGFQNAPPRALGSLGMQRNVRAAMEGFQDAPPRALGNLGMNRTTQVAMDIEGGDGL